MKSHAELLAAAMEKMQREKQDRPEAGKTYSLLEIAKGKSWKDSEVQSNE
tara:strand:+ start:616 stop:765 length:150 start_codon:yes stop_codon:yes gene_type:complete